MPQKYPPYNSFIPVALENDVVVTQSLIEFRAEFAAVEEQLIRSRHNLRLLKGQGDYVLLNGTARLNQRAGLAQQVSLLA